MKTLKNRVIIFAALVGMATAIAFKAPARLTTTNEAWEYISGVTTSPSSYVFVSSPPPCTPPGRKHICYILAPENPGDPSEPVIDLGLANRILTLDTSNGDVFLKL